MCTVLSRSFSSYASSHTYSYILSLHDALPISLNAVDFDDLITLPAQMLEDPVTRTLWRQRLAYLLVDEYQDTRQAQYRLLSRDRKSTRLNSSHVANSYAVFCLKNKNSDDET